jgi:phenylalanyl-tRNA synthetase beta subunit
MQSIEILRNLYYLTQNLREEGRKDIQELLENARILPDNNLQEELRRVRFQIERIKQLVGCKLSDDEINRAVEWLTSAGDGYVGLPSTTAAVF